MSDARGRLSLAPPTYRRIDRITKLVGVVCVAVGLEVGGYTFEGIALGVLGATLALSTVFVNPTTDSTCDSSDE